MSYTLYCLVLAAVFCVGSLGQDDCNFKCTGERTFVQAGLKFTCTGSNLCNKYNANYDCKPCVNYTQKCRNFYKCVSYKPYDTIIGGTQVKCPDQYKCNSQAVGECAPCVHKGCSSEPDYVCDAVDSTIVYVQNVAVNCMGGTVCNKDNVAPCYPCIEPASAKARYGAYLLD